jgi:hypothetical protein
MSLVTSFPTGLTTDACRDWTALAAPTLGQPTFDPESLHDLPEPVRRWLIHTLRPGTPLQTTVELRMHGEIRLGTWRPFTARQRISFADGFVWAATARLFGLPVIGFDRYTRGSGQMRWRLLNAIPVMAAAGPDVTRSGAGRHAGELLLATPAAALSPQVVWQAIDAERATAQVEVGRRRHEVTLMIAPNGAVRELVMNRWGNQGRDSFAERAFGAVVTSERTFDGVTIPTNVVAGWEYGSKQWSEGQFIRYTVDEATYR